MFYLAEILFWAALFLIFYAYILFPLSLILLARLFGKYKKEDLSISKDPPKVTMIVAAYNEEKVLSEKLKNTWKIDYPPELFTLSIGSDGSSDRTPEILKSCEDSRLRSFLFSERRGKISVLNDLLKEAEADIVVMSDANTMYSPDAIRKMIPHFQDPNVGCVSGELILDDGGGVSGEGLYWKYEGFIKRKEGELGLLIGCNGGIYALRRELYDPLPANTIVDDFVISMRILEKGYQTRFEPEAQATEAPCASSYAETVRKIRIGAGNYQALGLTGALLHPKYGLRAYAYWGHKVLRWMIPFFLIIAFLLNLALAFGTRRVELYDNLLILQVCGIIASAISYRLPSGKKIPKWIRPVSYFYLMNFALFCGFLRFLFKTQRVTWDRAFT